MYSYYVLFYLYMYYKTFYYNKHVIRFSWWLIKKVFSMVWRYKTEKSIKGNNDWILI